MLLYSFSLNAQAQKTEFPITGTFKLAEESKTPHTDFNKVIITKDDYSVLMNDDVLRTYRLIIKNSDNSYLVEEYFADPEKRDRVRFNLSLEKEQYNHYHIVVTLGNQVEKLHLIKL